MKNSERLPKNWIERTKITSSSSDGILIPENKKTFGRE
jgi:hypothetical protein